MNINLDRILSRKHEYDVESQRLIDELVKENEQFDLIDEMKKGRGWSVIENIIRQWVKEDFARIMESVDEKEVMAAKGSLKRLIHILKIVNTKERRASLDDELEKYVSVL